MANWSPRCTVHPRTGRRRYPRTGENSARQAFLVSAIVWFRVRLSSSGTHFRSGLPKRGLFGYRPERKAQDAAKRVWGAAYCGKTQVIDVDLESYFDNVRHNKKVAARVNDPKVMHLLKLILKAGDKRGVPQGGVISPLLANLYLNEVDKMLEKAKSGAKDGRGTHIEYARFADDLVILVDDHPRW